MNKLRQLSDEELRKVQLEELEILKYVKQVCDKYKINYFLDWGTLLGAVRHKGFIPWDNDIDVGMLRKDYEKFLDVFEREDNDNFILQNWYTDERWPLSYTKVRKKNTIFISNYVENNQTDGYSGFNIDIFVYDDIPMDHKIVKSIDSKLKHIQRIMFMKVGYRPWFLGDKYSLVKRLFYLPYQLMALFYSEDGLVRLAESIIQSYSNEDTVFYHGGTENIHLYEKNKLIDLVELEFEGDIFKCPKDYNSILTANYDDYMKLPPEHVRRKRGYVLEMQF